MNVQLKQICQRLSLSLLLTTCQVNSIKGEEYIKRYTYVHIWKSMNILLGIYIKPQKQVLMFHVPRSYLLFSFDFRVSHTDYPICFACLRITISNTLVYRHIHMHNSSCICVCLLTRIFAHLTYKRNARELKKTAWNIIV